MTAPWSGYRVEMNFPVLVGRVEWNALWSRRPPLSIHSRTTDSSASPDNETDDATACSRNCHFSIPHFFLLFPVGHYRQPCRRCTRREDRDKLIASQYQISAIINGHESTLRNKILSDWLILEFRLITFVTLLHLITPQRTIASEYIREQSHFIVI